MLVMEVTAREWTVRRMLIEHAQAKIRFRDYQRKVAEATPAEVAAAEAKRSAAWAATQASAGKATTAPPPPTISPGMASGPARPSLGNEAVHVRKSEEEWSKYCEQLQREGLNLLAPARLPLHAQRQKTRALIRLRPASSSDAVPKRPSARKRPAAFKLPLTHKRPAAFKRTPFTLKRLRVA